MQGKNESENAQTCFVTISLSLFLVQVYALCCYNFCLFLVDVEIMVVSLGSGPLEEEGKFYRVRLEDLFFPASPGILVVPE